MNSHSTLPKKFNALRVPPAVRRRPESGGKTGRRLAKKPGGISAPGFIKERLT
jgi:hypothetical protein